MASSQRWPMWRRWRHRARDVRAMPGAAAAIEALASAGTRQSVLTGNIRPLAELKLGLAGLGDHLDLDVGAYGDAHEVRAELVPVARRAAGGYGTDFPAGRPCWSVTRRWTSEAALATGARAVGSRPGATPRRNWPPRARMSCCPT